MYQNIIVEVCCGSVADCIAAQNVGAHRLELNSALPLGGLTPSTGCVRLAKAKVELPVIAMIRPRPGDFCYDDLEIEAMIVDMQTLLEIGIDGFAWAVTDNAGNVNVNGCRRILDAIDRGDSQSSRPKMVYHRAFDIAPDWRTTTVELIDLGFHRILTSGQQKTAIRGMKTIKQLQSEFGDKIEILPGSGINPSNALKLIETTGCTQIHGSFSKSAIAYQTEVADFGGQSTVDSAQIQQIVFKLQKQRQKEDH